MYLQKIIIAFIIAIFLPTFSYAMNKTEILDIIHKCEIWASNNKKSIEYYDNNYQQHITACQKHNILTLLSRQYGNKTLIPNVVYGNFITIFDNQMYQSWKYDNKKITKSEYSSQFKEFKSNLINIIKIMESS